MRDQQPPLALAIERVSHAFGNGAERVQAIEQLSLSVAPGEIVAVVGNSGCGKTTLLRLIAGLIVPDAGHIVMRQPAGWMPQRDLLLPWQTAAGNVALPLLTDGVSRQAALHRARQLLSECGLAEFTEHRPNQLSGGMRRRVAFARTLIGGNQLLLLDEPFTGLDGATRQAMREWLQRIQQQKRLTIVLVTHDIAEAVWFADRVAVLTPRPARLAGCYNVTLPRPRHRSLFGHTRFAAALAAVAALQEPELPASDN